ncbi:MAG: CPXCG motif-containing cysteine-rich protein [Arcobacter sp.]|nr:CPXCG motif-containing cysteine-rich protein [Arcobacter sp.]
MFKQNIQCPNCNKAITILLDINNQTFNSIIRKCELCFKSIEIDYYFEDNEIKTLSYNSKK